MASDRACGPIADRARGAESIVTISLRAHSPGRCQVTACKWSAVLVTAASISYRHRIVELRRYAVVGIRSYWGTRIAISARVVCGATRQTDCGRIGPRYTIAGITMTGHSGAGGRRAHALGPARTGCQAESSQTVLIALTSAAVCQRRRRGVFAQIRDTHFCSIWIEGDGHLRCGACQHHGRRDHEQHGSERKGPR
jgi:hypothetical protein